MKKNNIIIKTVKELDIFLENIAEMKNEESSLSPINQVEQKEIFIDTGRNPIFIYRINELKDNEKETLTHQKIEQLKNIKLKLKNKTKKNKHLENTLLKKKKEMLKRLAMISSIGKKEFTDYSIELYGKPDKELISKAKNILNILGPSPLSEKITKKKALKLLREGINHFNLDWKVEIDKKSICTRADIMRRKLKLKNLNKYSHDYIKRLIVHEIGTHIVRAENGNKQPYNIFRYGFPEYLETEEGFAAYNEFRSGFMSNSTLRSYAGRVLAIDYALKYSFSKTYLLLRKYFTKKNSWRLTVRAKRGLKDTSKKGAYTKDIVYLRGFLRILEHIRKKRDIDFLYAGKIGLDDIKSCKQIKGIKYFDSRFDELLEKNDLRPSKREIKKPDLIRLGLI